MNTNVNLEAALGFLALLGTGFLLVVSALVLLHALITRRLGRARIVFVAGVGILALYSILMLLFSFASSEKALAFGEEKHFCEIDCHLAYSVSGIRQAKTIGAGANAATARGVFYIITLKTRFDEKTISPTRGNAELYPNSRVVTVSDEQGRVYEPSKEGALSLSFSEGTGTPLTTPLRPGEVYTTELVFDLPADVQRPILLLREGEFETRFIIGHENSFLHKKTGFRLAP